MLFVISSRYMYIFSKGGGSRLEYWKLLKGAESTTRLSKAGQKGGGALKIKFPLL